MRRALGGLAAVLVLATAASAGEQALPRATTDRLDEAVGPQVHAVYAIPSDGADRGLDTSGAIENSVAAWTRWLAAETGGPTLRLDTSGGSLDVTFVRLPQTDAQIASRGSRVRDEVENQLRAAGLLRPNKLYAVYYDGTSTFACGGGAWPPTLTGQVAAMYLRGLPGAPVPCDSNGLAGPGEPPRYLDIAMLHELMHTLGFTATCAPHHTRAGHVSDSPNDLMWAGDAPWQLPPRLDIGRDDYYGHGRSDCADLARTPYLTSNPPPGPVPAPAPAPAPKLTAGRLVVGVARAGRPLEVRLPLRLGAAPPPAATVRCTASVGRTRLAATVARYTAGAARCRWTIPRGAAGKRVAGSVTARAAGVTATRSFSRTILR